MLLASAGYSSAASEEIICAALALSERGAVAELMRHLS
jgi:hypothetical protein